MTDSETISQIALDVKRYDYDHWLTTLFAPAEYRDSLFAVLAFNSEISRIRETVTEPMLGDIRLQWWREALSGLEKDIPKTHPVVQVLKQVNSQTPLDFKEMQAMVDMRARDLDPTPINDDEMLLSYADGTGGALHRLMNNILGGGNSSANVEAASRAGRSYALTGILRAVPFHFQHDLVLLPIQRLEDVGATRNTVFQEEHRSGFFNIVSSLADLAHSELTQARKAGRLADKQSKAARLVNALTSLYLKRLAAAKYDPADAKMSVGSQRKVLALYFQNFRKG